MFCSSEVPPSSEEPSPVPQHSLRVTQMSPVSWGQLAWRGDLMMSLVHSDPSLLQTLGYRVRSIAFGVAIGIKAPHAND